ncbi:optineurin-like isoform X2 [Periplaneta americana]|uniref:optineurin-like isoform X2 n=1 Tax=Periplaneta americana TaxID=6978 RepID=UPI0037E911E7
MVKVNESKHEDLHGPQSSMSSDGSFVVLERSPPQQPSSQFLPQPQQQSMVCPPVPPHNSYVGDLPRLESQVSQNSSIMVGSIPADLSPEEIQRKLHEVLQENLELKETLQQNNLAMKQQFNTLVMWQEELRKVHANHKAKFTETKELVFKLRAENTELRRIIEETKNEGSSPPSSSETELKMENVALKGRIAELQQKLATPVPRREQMPGGPPSKKEQELSALVEQLNRQLETAERARRQLTVDVERVTAQRKRLEQDLVTHKTELEDQKTQLHKAHDEREELEHKITRLMEQHRQELHEYAVIENERQQAGGISQSSAREIQRLVSQLDEQRALVNTLTHQLKDERAKVAAMSAGRAAPVTVNEHANLASDLKGCEETLGQITNCLDRESERFSSLDSWLQVAADSMNQIKGKQSVDVKAVETLKAEIQQLRNLLVHEKALSQEKKRNLEEAESKFHKLNIEYQRLLNELQSFQKEQKSLELQNNTYLEVQAKGFKERIDSMTAQLLTKEEALTQKNQEVTQMRDKLKKLELENEAITILKAQVEVYQSDFNAEREARENLAGEKERLAEDLRHLQRRNQQLLDELEAYQQRQFEEIQRQVPATTVASAPSAAVMAGGWNTIATPGRTQGQKLNIRTSPNRTSPGRTSPARPSPIPQSPQTPAPEEHDGPPFRGLTEQIVVYCPQCGMEFRSLTSLEEHIMDCLNLET